MRKHSSQTGFMHAGDQKHPREIVLGFYAPCISSDLQLRLNRAKHPLRADRQQASTTQCLRVCQATGQAYRSIRVTPRLELQTIRSDCMRQLQPRQIQNTLSCNRWRGHYPFQSIDGPVAPVGVFRLMSSSITCHRYPVLAVVSHR